MHEVPECEEFRAACDAAGGSDDGLHVVELNDAGGDA